MLEAGLLSMACQTNVLLFSWVELHVPHFIGLWKGRVEGEHPGAAEEMWVTLSWALVQILWSKSRSPEGEVWAEFPEKRGPHIETYSATCMSFVCAHLSLSKGTLTVVPCRECMGRHRPIYPRAQRFVQLQVEGTAAPFYLASVQRNFYFGMGGFWLCKNMSAPCFLWTIETFHSKE